MKEKNIRTALLIGEEGIDKLSRARVAVFGVGGVGGYAVEALARAGIGELTLIDADTVSESNINRQIIATNETLGEAKVEAFRKRIALIDPGCKVNAIREFATPENLPAFGLSGYDHVIDAIDTVSTKTALAVLCESEGIPLISSMGTGNKLDPTALRVSDIYKTSVCPLARVMRTELKRRGVRHLRVVWSDEVPTKPDEKLALSLSGGGKTVGSISFVPSSAGLIIASEVIKELIK